MSVVDHKGVPNSQPPPPSPTLQVPNHLSILLVDDNPSIHRDFFKILTPNLPANASALARLEVDVFGESDDLPAPFHPTPFNLQVAFQGEEAIEKVRQSLAIHQPFAMAFVDVRLPPGIDGIETIERLWKVDPKLQIVLCTAYADYSWQEITRRLGRSEHFVILRKPFDPVEVLQLAHAFTEKWRLSHIADLHLNHLEALVEVRTAALTREIAERRHTEQELLKARLAADKASRAKSAFLANMSHEIRTPMNGVLGMCQLLLETPLSPHQRDLAETLATSSEVLLALLNDVLDISKIEANRLELDVAPFALDSLILESVRLLEPKAASAGLQLIADIHPETAGPWLGDAVRLRQVILNLLSNALKFTPQGSVTLSVQPVSQPSPNSPHSPKHPHLQFTVTDTGIGIAPNDLPHLFTSFVQADASITRRFGGTGLGLAICKRLVELMGGSITAQSSPGQGSTFTFHIPLQPAPIIQSPPTLPPPVSTPHPHQHPPSPPPSPLPLGDRHPSPRLLVVEDNAVNRKVALLHLQRLGLNADIATNGLEALEAFQTRPYQLILMDCQMPEMDGFSATRLIRASETTSSQRIPIVAMTAGTLTGDRECCFAAGMDDYLTKPVRKSDLQAVLQRHLPAPYTLPQGG